MGAEITTHIPALLLGVLLGLFAFLPLLLALLPVLRKKSDANMAKGMLGVIASFAILFVGVVLTYVLMRSALLALTVGELAGFFVGLIAITLMVIAL